MSKRAEEAQASAILPESIISYAKEHAVLSGLVYREGVKYGYEQAEKDLALTWEDIKVIYEIFDALDNEHHSTFNMGIQQYFQEALRRFNEWREKK